MATLTGIISGGKIREIGQPISMNPPEFYPTIITFGNEQYVHSGNLVTYSSDYAELKNRLPTMSYINLVANANVLLTNSNATRNWANVANSSAGNQQLVPGTGHLATIEKSNTDILMLVKPIFTSGAASNSWLAVKFGPNIANLATGNSNVTFTATQTYESGSGFYDSLTFGGRVIVCGGTGLYSSTYNPPYYDPTFGGVPASFTQAFSYGRHIVQTNTNSFSYISGTNASATFTQSSGPTANWVYYALASNGNHIVAAVGAPGTNAGAIQTSTDGLTWTSRTPNTAMIGALRRAVYSNAANAYIYMTDRGFIYTTTDGFNLTNRTSPLANLSSIVSLAYEQSLYSATSTTNTFIVISSNTMVRTSNGVSYFTVPFETDANLNYISSERSNVISIIWANNRFIMSTNSGRTIYSTDDGATWRADNTKYVQNVANQEGGYTIYQGAFVDVAGGNVIYSTVRNTFNVLPVNVSSGLLAANPSLVGTTTSVGGWWIRLK